MVAIRRTSAGQEVSDEQVTAGEDGHAYAHRHRMHLGEAGGPCPGFDRVQCLGVTDVMQTEDMKARQRVNTALVAGLGAGVVGALSSVGAELVLNVPFPLLTDTAVSAFLAGLAGGLLYAVLIRIVRRPVSLLWILTLGIATVDSLLIALLPLPAGQGLQAGTPFDGLMIPIAQLGALLGVGHFGTTHFPAMYLPADTVLHYIPALAVAVLVPRWAQHHNTHATHEAHALGGGR
jgi:hypothetical protein